MTDRISWRSIACVAFGMGLLASACGGSGSDESTTGAEASVSSSSAVAESSSSGAESSGESSGEGEAADDAESDETTVASQPSTFTNPDGTEVEIGDASRIVVLNGDLAEVIWALGLGDQVVATDISATFPPDADSSEKIGYQRALGAEAILSFEPTIVIGNTDAGPPEVIDQVIAAGVPVAILDYGSDLAAVSAKISNVGYILGAQDEADELIADIEQRIADVVASITDGDERGVLLYFRGASTQLIAGAGSGSDALFPTIGLVDGGTESGAKGIVAITPEALIVAAPDVIIVTESGLQSIGGIDGLMEVPGIAQTPAAETGRVLAYDDQLLLGFGPRVADLITQLHTDISGGVTYEEQTAKKKAAAAFVALFADYDTDLVDRQAFLVDPDGELTSSLEDYVEAAKGANIEYAVTGVELDGEAATVIFSVLLGGNEMASQQRVPFQADGDDWVIVRDDYCAFLALAHSSCP